MKTRIFFIAILLLGTSYIFSQDEIVLPKLKPSNDYWTIGYYANGDLSLINEYYKQDEFQPGIGGTVEIDYHDTEKEFILSFGINKIISKHGNGNFEVMEFTLGQRIRLFKNSGYFCEIGISYISTRRTIQMPENRNWDFYSPIYNNAHLHFGFSSGLGKRVHLSSSKDLLFKIKYVSTITRNGSSFAYLSASSGLTFSTKQDAKNRETKPKPKRFGLAFLLGAANPGALEKANFNWGLNYGLGLSYNFTPKVSLIAEYNSSSINGINSAHNYKESSSSLTALGRFYFNESKVSPFVDIGGGIYSHKLYATSLGVTAEVVDEIDNLPGFNLGSGIKFSLIENIDLVAKGTMHILIERFSDTSPNYFTLQGGARFNL